MKRVLWSEAATRDLTAIKARLTENYGAPVADRTIAELVRAASWLLEFPNAGPSMGIATWRKWRPRGVPHLLIYKPVKQGIEVMRVRHARDDWQPAPRP
jgi:toxin ParE1/3/4